MSPSAPPNPPRPAPKLRQVAAEAGVHFSTVSRALNPATRHLVAAPVAERVQAVAARLGYRVDAAASALRSGRSRLVGALVPGIANPVFAPILAGAAAALTEADHALLVADPGDDPARAAAFVAELASRRVDGMLLATAAREHDPAVAACLQRSLPVVLINRACARGTAVVPAVVPDDVAGMRLIVAHLSGLGHRRIGHLAGPATLSTGLLRRQGFEQAMAECGLHADGDAPIEVAEAFDRPAGRLAADRLLARPDRPTALACANDLLALGAYDACYAAGLRIPEDISVSGHNDMPLVDMITPGLTTVRIPHDAMGRQAAALLLETIRRGASSGITVLPPTLVVRGSTAPPGRRGASHERL
nr:LacI family DNA-binding transcriptional regulator [Roseomonas acroporae]